MYKVFFNKKVLYFKRYLDNSDANILSTDYSQEAIEKYINDAFLNFNDPGYLIICNRQIDACWNDFCSKFKKITAAGGIVINDQNKLLFIKRHGLWDLPKGKCEKGEKIEDCAVREIEEECGIHNLKLDIKLEITYHTYLLKEKPVLKETHWYLLNYSDNEILIPQTEESITEVKWFTVNDLDQIISKTYPSIIDVINSYLNKLKK